MDFLPEFEWPEEPEPDPEEEPARKRGGQPGNTNALKHGFYSRGLKPADLVGLEEGGSVSLKDEIDLLRIYIRRVVDLSADVQELDTAVNLLRSLCLASLSITRLVRVQSIVTIPNDDFRREISESVDRVCKQFGIDKRMQRGSRKPWEKAGGR